MTTFLILGGTGKTGRRIVSRLAADGREVRVAARTAAPVPDGTSHVRFDWHDPATHDAALAGVDALYLVAPAFRLDYGPTVAAFVERAAAAGVKRVVYLAARGSEHEPEGPMQQVERALARSGLEWTVLRPTWFMQNFTEEFWRPDVEQGVIAAPTGPGAIPFVDADDIAAVAAAALSEDGHAGEVYELSGPRAMSFGEAAAILGAQAGHPVVHADVSPEAFVAGLRERGLPADYAQLLATILGIAAAGHDAFLSDGVQRALGREPVSFEDWAAREVAPAFAIA